MANIDVSVIIPIKDESDQYISQCIDSLKKQDYTGTFEVIVTKGGNRAQARNLGISKSGGEIIAFIDADCVAPEKWLSVLVETFNENNTLGGVGGTNFSPTKGTHLSKAIDIVFSSFLGSLGSASLTEPSKPKYVSALACINSAFKRKTLQDIGGFDEEFELCEDTNLSYKVRDTGHELLFVTNNLVWHYRRDTMKRFAEQFFLYGLGRMRSILTNKRYSGKGVTSMFSAAILFPLIVWFSPLSAAAILSLYTCAIFVVGIKGAARTHNKCVLYLAPSLLVVEHFSYIFGMFYGVTKGKWKKPTKQPEIFYHEVLRTTQLQENLTFFVDTSIDSEKLKIPLSNKTTNNNK